ncbi:MAG: hypothetical protein R2845_16360 [Thermomicrobiales bacterium]
MIGSVPVSAQEKRHYPTGFDPLPAEGELLGFASGELDGSGVATLIVERIINRWNRSIRLRVHSS